MGVMRSANNILVGKPEGKRLLSGPRVVWEDDIKMDLREWGWKLGTGVLYSKDHQKL